MATKRSPRRPTRRTEPGRSPPPVTLTSLPAFRKSESKSDHLINAIIETPRGSRCKFKYDPDRGVFELHRMLAPDDPYPYDFGFIPSTLAEDGDPLDVLVLLEATQFPGCVVPSRLIGVLEIEQREHGEEGKPVRNDRLIAVGAASRTYGSLREITDLPEALLSELEAFFAAAAAEGGKTIRVLARRGADASAALVQRAHRVRRR